MSWSPHISSVANRAHQRLGFIRRTLRGCPYRYREIAYQSLVRSQMEYASAIWDTTIQKDSDSLERVQRKAARWARGQYGTVSVTGLLKELGWDELALRRRNQRLVLFYKILGKEIAIPPDSVDIVQNIRPARNKHSRQIRQVHGKDKCSPLWRGTIVSTVPQWNKLPTQCVEAESLDSFKAQLGSTIP